MERIFTIEEARALMPDVLARAEEFVAIRADMSELAHDLRRGERSPIGGLAEAKAFEARMDEILGWFDEQGIEVKGVAPLLVDFPAELDGVPVRLCWLEGDAELAWYHRTDLGFPGRRPLG
ncbi:hypothetical protein Misp01_61540 [Microtetraspora sp. NBRC 13810]|uniref:DUF2203 domain-containing protein n=1 Tax=Microtetraspora sp. NBRC 13810 TaxID=3030990 RepID=UPI0024A52035|nr:DUF2203 domain-containing protein [Microtetraspora sp. NBRC 13810]GLW11026.1 hypothetical protein Misp01_61540 [Microtetraspora sp. NBRC 13810]